MASIIDRSIRAAKLEVELYEEVEKDPEALLQAMVIVVLSSLAMGIGAVGQSGLRGLFGMGISALVGWYLWAFITYLLGTKLLPEPNTRSDMGELLRTIGFSSSPRFLGILGFIPVLGRLIFIAVSIWSLAAFVIAVRQALDYQSTGRAVAVCVVGWLIQGILFWVIMAIFGAVNVIF